MNDAAATMKEWRRAQTAQAAPVAITVPEGVHQLHSQALAALWQSAQNTANESLRTAQAGWEAERAEAETINKQLGDAYDAQAVELDAANRRIDELAAKYEAEQKQTTELALQIEQAQKATLVAENRAVIAEQRAVEIERRAADLRAELDRAHQDAVQTRTELADVRQAQQEQRNTAAQEALRAAERLTATQAERDEARKEAAKAREETAHWRGQVEALKEQQMGFLEAIKTGKKPSRAGE
jgi:predicted  nucleic acid-binding Zn-ribbon protein